MPVQMEDGLPRTLADVDDDLVVVEPGGACSVGDENQHPACLVGRELADLAKRLDVTLRDDEQMGFRLRVDIPDREEAGGRVDVVALAVELAEKAVVTHARCRL